MNLRTLRYLKFAVLGIAEHPRRAPRRRAARGPVRSPKYRAWIRTQPSIVSGLFGCEACHTGSDGGMGSKASDPTCVPLTPAEHREYHRIGKVAFAIRYGLDFKEVVSRLNAAYAAKVGKL